MGQLTKAHAEMQKANNSSASFSDFMKQFKPVFQSVLPTGFTADRLVQMDHRPQQDAKAQGVRHVIVLELLPSVRIARP